MAWSRDSGEHVDVVRELLTGAVLRVIVVGRTLRSDVLPQGPAQRDVEHLRPAADREHRFVRGERPFREQHLGAIELVVHLDGAIRARLLAIELRLDVGATGEADAVTQIEERAQSRLGERCADSQWCPAGALQRVEVGAVAGEVGGKPLLVQDAKREADHRRSRHGKDS